MATVDWSGGDAIVPPSTRTVILTDADDVSQWLAVNGPCEIAVDGGDAYSVEIYRSYGAPEGNEGGDAVLVDAQDEDERVARYDFIGSGAVQIKLAAITNGPVTVTLAR